MWKRGRSGTYDVWARERVADPDGAWLRDAYGLSFAEREFLRETVQRGEVVPHERLREPAVAYAQRLLERPWWRRRYANKINGRILLVVVSGMWLLAVLALASSGWADSDTIVPYVLGVLAMLHLTVDLLWLRTRRLRRAERLNRHPCARSYGEFS
jgi:hypothetical protein